MKIRLVLVLGAAAVAAAIAARGLWRGGLTGAAAPAAREIAGPAAAPEGPSGGPPAAGESPSRTEPTASEGSAPDVLDVADGEDWPRFMGPRGDGISRERGWIKDWEPAGPPALWRARVGEAYSAPVTTGGRLVFFHRIGDEEVIHCVEAETGDGLWHYRYPTQYEDRYGYNGGPRCSPIIDGDRVYAYGAEGKLTCVEFEDGRLVWQRHVNAEYGVPQNFFGAGTSPVVEGDLLLLNLGGSNGAGLAAFDKHTGRTVWTTSSDGASYSTPAVITLRGERLAVFFTQDGLLVVEARSGAERYRYRFRSALYESVNAASPVVLDDLVFLSATYNTGAVLLRLAAGGLEEVWKDRLAMQNHWATSIPHEGFLYGMDGRHEAGSNFRCIELMTGRIRWTADQGLGRASYLLAEGHLIALGERGELALIELNPDRYVEKHRTPVLRYPCWTPPVLSHGLLFLRNENTLLCLDLRPRRQ